MDDLGPTTTTGPAEWLAGVPDVASRLRREPPDRVLVVGCGDGRDAIAVALEFPTTTVYGVDTHAAAVEAASATALGSRARDRLLFWRGDPLHPRMPGGADVVVAVGLLTDPARADKPGVMTLLIALAGLTAPRGLVVLDSPVPLVASTAVAAGFVSVEQVGESVHGCPAFLLRS
jgi:SAM-dependent methyltransferase